MSKSNLIRGAGGGGKSGGGSARVAQEAPDSLRSKQYARVIDLVSEGEIVGLVNGLQSVYLDDTPVQNADGTFNFDGVTLYSRNGEQSQDVVPGFSEIEAESAVSVEVTRNAPTVRSITSDMADYARVTVSVPRLTKQDVTNGDIDGTSVRVAIDVQSNGGGFVAQKIGFGTLPLQVAGAVASSVNQEILSASVRLTWTGGVVTSSSNWYSQPQGAPQSIRWRLEYREVGNVTWLALRSGSFSGSGRYENRITGGLGGSRVYVAPTDSVSIPFSPATQGVYEFRYVILSGTGTLKIGGDAQTFLLYDDIRGKTSSKYQRAYRIPLTGEPPWDIRVRRLTADSTSQALQNQTFWDSFTEIVDQRLRYPNRAYFALSVDAERFSTIPVRGYEIKGLIVQVPSNYDPVDRTYDGVWDGSFKPEWTDNPAWIFYDLITNERYGCGQFINPDLVDKWALYEISQYCDEMVSDGLGGMEPRFACNVYLQQREEAYKVLQSLASVFRGITYFSGGMIVPVQDSPKEAVALFTPANVEGGEFNYSGSSAKTRATVVLVSWNDPADRYRQAIEYVEDEAGIRERGIIQKEVDAIGCTSRGQAHRFGRSIIYAESMEVETVTFVIGLDGFSLAPGDVIKTTDPVRAGKRQGGRILAATTTEITLDSEVEIGGQDYTLWLVMPDGSVESRTVINSPGVTNTLTVASAYSDVPLDYAIWVLGANDLEPEEWRVISISENESDYTATVTALEYRSDKYAAIEEGIILDDRPTSALIGRTQSPVTNVVTEEELYLINAALVGVTLSVSWQGEASYYEVEYKRGDGNYQRITTSATAVNIQPVTAGAYTLRIVAINALGVRSQPEIKSVTVNGLTAPPADVAEFHIQAINGNAHLSFAPAADLDVKVGGYLRIRHSPLLTGATWSSAVNIGQQLPGNATHAVLPLLQGTYLAKWVDSSGNQSVNATSIITNAPSVFNLNFIESATEHESFAGVRDGVVVSTFASTPAVIIDSIDLIDDRLDLADDWGAIDTLGGVLDSGIYYFDNSIDLGSVVTSVVTGNIEAQSYNTTNDADGWPEIDSLETIDGDDPSLSSVTLQMRTTDDDPSGTPTWSEWAAFAVGDVTARAFEFRVWMETDLSTQNVALLKASVTVDMPDKLQSGDDLTAPETGLTVVFDPPFYVKPAIGISAQAMATGDRYEITNKTKEGFDIMFYNASDVAIARTFDYIARAY